MKNVFQSFCQDLSNPYMIEKILCDACVDGFISINLKKGIPDVQTKKFNNNAVEIINKMRNHYDIYYDFNLQKIGIGGTQSEKRGITINPYMDNNLKISTLIHEMAHDVLKHKYDDAYINSHLNEMEAEAVVYLVMAHFGISHISSILRCRKNASSIKVTVCIDEDSNPVDVTSPLGFAKENMFERLKEREKEILKASEIIIGQLEGGGICVE